MAALAMCCGGSGIAALLPAAYRRSPTTATNQVWCRTLIMLLLAHHFASLVPAANRQQAQVETPKVLTSSVAGSASSHTYTCMRISPYVSSPDALLPSKTTNASFPHSSTVPRLCLVAIFGLHLLARLTAGRFYFSPPEQCTSSKLKPH